MIKNVSTKIKNEAKEQKGWFVGKYYHNEPIFNGFCSKNNLPKMNDETYVILEVCMWMIINGVI